MDLTEILQRASSLMTPEGQQKIEMARKKNADNYNSNGEFMSERYVRNVPTETAMNPTMTPTMVKHSTLPKAIMESMMEHPITIHEGTSILDNYDIATPKAQTVNEQHAFTMSSTPQQTYVPPVASIDYNYIRMIVNECIQSNLQQIKEEILKESSLKAIRLGSENKIQLIDNKNNLYESKLEFKKNISKKQ